MRAEVYVIGVDDPYIIEIDDWNEFEIYYLGGNVKKFIKVNDRLWVNTTHITMVGRLQ